MRGRAPDMLRFVVRDLGVLLASVSAIAGVTLLLRNFTTVSSTTTALVLLLIVLAAATVATLRVAIAASIVAISSIHLLRVFMNAQQTDNDKILWYVVLHLTFVFSALLLGVLDRIAFAAKREK